MRTRGGSRGRGARRALHDAGWLAARQQQQQPSTSTSLGGGAGVRGTLPRVDRTCSTCTSAARTPGTCPAGQEVAPETELICILCVRRLQEARVGEHLVEWLLQKAQQSAAAV